MLIICVGVGFFGGLNTFAFMAAEVRDFRKCYQRENGKAFCATFLHGISEMDLCKFFYRQTNFSIDEAPVAMVIHISTWYPLYLYLWQHQNKNVIKICVIEYRLKSGRTDDGDDTSERNRKLVICRWDLQYFAAISSMQRTLERWEKVMKNILDLNMTTLILFTDRKQHMHKLSLSFSIRFMHSLTHTVTHAKHEWNRVVR